MDLLAREELASLIGPPKWPRVSLFMPTYRTGPEVQQNPIRLKNLLQRAEESLTAGGMRGPDARDLLAPATALIEDGLFWRELSEGLAVYVAEGEFRRYRLPIKFADEQVMVNDRFHVKPLLPLFSGDGRFYILALSQQEVRVFQATRMTVSEVDVEGMPKGIDDALRYDEHEREVGSFGGQPGRGGDRGGIYYGIGARKDVTKTNLLRYFQHIDRSLRPVLHDERVPLLVAGVDYLLPIYREANTYEHLLEQGLPGNPEVLNDKALQQQAWQIVEPYFRREQEAALARYNELVGTGRASSDARDIVVAAHQGRVDTLLATMAEEIWGSYDPAAASAEVHANRQAGDADLADLATVRTIAGRGAIYTLAREQMPGGAPLAAIYRY